MPLPAPPDPHAIAAMALTVLAFVLFMRDRIPIEETCLFVLIALALGFQILPYERDGRTLPVSAFLHGFGHEALVTICALMIIGRALERTGALEPLARVMARAWATNPSTSLLATLVFTGLLSAFMNNTPLVVMLLPILVGIAVRTKNAASGILMPFGLATLLGGSGTTIGSSTNLLVVAVAADLGMRRLEMFDFTLPALISGAIGIAYLWLVAPRLLPVKDTPLADRSVLVYDATLHVNETSRANGESLAEVLKLTDSAMRVTQIQRGPELFIVRLPTATIRAGDRLYVSDSRERLKQFETALGATLHNVRDAEHPVDEEHPLSAEGQQLAEVVVTAGSALRGRTLRQTRFRENYNVVMLAIHRAGSHTPPLKRGLGDVVLETGDVLLIQGPSESIRELKERAGMLVLDGTVDLPHTRKAPLALGIFLAVVGLAAGGLLPISVSALLGTGLVLASGCLTWREATGALSTPVVLVIVASLALGVALTATGGADYLAQVLVAASSGLPPLAVMSGLMLLMACLTNVVSNTATAVIGTPIAFRIALELGVSPEPFVLAVLFGANMSYATPVGYQTNILLMNAGGYRFADFLRVGTPLVLLMWVSLTVLLPMFFAL